MKDNWRNLALILVLCLTLGMAPFIPEPHLWGKLKWIAGGAQGMGATDWFDFAMHSAPWWWLLGYSVKLLRKRLRTT